MGKTIGKPKWKLLTRRFYADVVLYDETLRFQTGHTVAEKSFPALRVHKRFQYDPEYFTMLDSEIGEYEEHTGHPMVGEILGRYGGKDEVRKRLLAEAEGLEMVEEK